MSSVDRIEKRSGASRAEGALGVRPGVCGETSGVRIRAKSCWPLVNLLVLLFFAVLPSRAASLGTATFTAQSSCPAGSLLPARTVCYKVTVSRCSGGSQFVAWLKVTKPSGTAKGTVLFMTGEDGLGWYDQNFVFGSLIVGAVVQAGYAAAQVNFQDFSSSPIQEPNGWFTVLDGSNAGPLALACRFATLADDFFTSKTYPGGHLGATGNSGGGALIAYALANYGLGTGPVLTLAEITSGPPLARVDYGCLCNQLPTLTPSGQGYLPQCYEGAAAIVDAAYAATPMACTGSTSSHVEPAGIDFQTAGIITGSETTSYPQTTVNILFAGQDNSSAVPNGTNWASASVISAKKLNLIAIPDARHSLPDSLPGALQLIADLTSF